MKPKVANLSGVRNRVSKVLKVVGEKEGEIQEILVIWREKNEAMFYDHSDLSSLLFLGMMKLISDDISEQKREGEQTSRGQ